MTRNRTAAAAFDAYDLGIGKGSIVGEKGVVANIVEIHLHVA